MVILCPLLISLSWVFFFSFTAPNVQKTNPNPRPTVSLSKVHIDSLFICAYLVHVMVLKAFHKLTSSPHLSCTASSIPPLIFHLLPSSLQIHNLMVKVPHPPFIPWTQTPAKQATYTKGYEERATAHRQDNRAARRTPAPRGTMVRRTPTDCSAVLFGTIIYTNTMASTTLRSHTRILIMQTHYQTRSSRIPTFSSRLVRPRVASSRRRSRSASTRCLKLRSRTTMHRCRPFTSILTHTQPMASRLSSRALSRLSLQRITMLQKPKNTGHMQRNRTPGCEVAGSILGIPGWTNAWKQVGRVSRDWYRLDTRIITALTLYNEMPTHRHASRSQNLREGLRETWLDMIPLPAPPLDRCRGIVSEGLRRIPAEHFKEGSYHLRFLILQTTLPSLEHGRNEYQTGLSLGLRAKPFPEGGIHPDKMHRQCPDRQEVAQLISSSQALTM